MPFFWGGETEWTLILIRMMFECISMMLLVFHGGEIKPTDFFITTYIYTYIPILHRHIPSLYYFPTWGHSQTPQVAEYILLTFCILFFYRGGCRACYVYSQPRGFVRRLPSPIPALPPTLWNSSAMNLSIARGLHPSAHLGKGQVK